MTKNIPIKKILGGGVQLLINTVPFKEGESLC